MKKIFATMIVMLCVSISAMAGSDIKVKEGNKKFFKTAQGKAVLELVWDGATYDNEKPLAKKFDNLKELKKAAWTGFQENFNDNCKKVKVVEDAKEAQYKFTMKVTNVDQYFKVMGFIPGNATKIWGTFTISDIQTGEVLVVVEVDEVDGGANPNPVECFSDAFEELADQIADLK